MSSNSVLTIGGLFVLGLTFFLIFMALQGSPFEIPPVYLFLFEFLIIGAGGACVYSLANRN